MLKEVIDFETAYKLYKENIILSADYIYCTDILNKDNKPVLLKSLNISNILNSISTNSVIRISAPYKETYENFKIKNSGKSQ